MLHTLESAGLQLLWLIPIGVCISCCTRSDGFACSVPMTPTDAAGLGTFFWVTSVREAIDRLLPVASVGGGVVGVRLVRCAIGGRLHQAPR